MALASYKEALRLYRHMLHDNMSYNANMVAKHSDHTTDTHKETLGELNMMDNPPGLPQGWSKE